MFPLTMAGLDRGIDELRRPLSAVGFTHRDAGATSVTQEPPPGVS
jgi:hypothetical protein